MSQFQQLMCLHCGNVHDGSYGSGKFCGLKCSNSFGRKGKSRKPKSEEARKMRKSISSIGGLALSKKRTEEKATRIKSGKWEDLLKNEIKPRILLEQNYLCALCNIPMHWNGQPLNFDLDHIDGNRTNESRDNLRCLCPNCHSQTPTYKNKNSGKEKISTDAEIIDALLSSESVYNALKSLNMNLHGGNYTRIRKIIKQYNLKLNYLAI